MSKAKATGTKNLTKRTTVHETFGRFVQAGALTMITFGPLAQKIAVISDIVDQNRVIVDGPTSDVPRQVVSVNWLAITNYRVDGVGRGASTKAIKAALAKDDVVSKWKASAWGKKTIGREIKAGLNDFERFQFNHSKKLLRHEVRKQYVTLRRAAAGLGPKAPRKRKAAKGKPTTAPTK